MRGLGLCQKSSALNIPATAAISFSSGKGEKERSNERKARSVGCMYLNTKGLSREVYRDHLPFSQCRYGLAAASNIRDTRGSKGRVDISCPRGVISPEDSIAPNSYNCTNASSNCGRGKCGGGWGFVWGVCEGGGGVGEVHN